MIRKTPTFSIVLAVATLSVVAPFWAWHRTRLQLSEAGNTLREQAAAIARLSIDKSRPIEPPVPSLTTDELKELLRLRDEVGRLRETVAERKNLRAALQNSGPTAPTEAPGGPNYWPVDQLANAGRATPEAALKTWLWAEKSGDLKTMISCMEPEMQAEIRAEIEFQEQKEVNATQNIEKEFKDKAAEMFSHIPGFRLVDEKSDSPDEMTILLSYEGQGVAEKFRLKKVGSNWTLGDNAQPEIYDPGQHL